MHTLMYFIYTSVIILLIYNFTTTIFFNHKNQLLATYKSFHRAQQMTLAVIFFAMILYLCKASSIPTKFYTIPWIWGFLTSHLFTYRKKRWIHELLGLGILLAITIVLYFKQEDIIQTITLQKLKAISIEIVVVYIMLGLLFGAVFWPKSKS